VHHPLTILKFGGSVLRSEEDLRRGVHEAYRWIRGGSKVVVVVSAFEGTTDTLLTQARSYTDATDDKACALLLATGEFTTASLLSLAFSVQASLHESWARRRSSSRRGAAAPMPTPPRSIAESSTVRSTSVRS
jgi:aspartokinase